MTFANSKYTQAIVSARESVMRFGVSGIKMKRLVESQTGIPSAQRSSLGDFQEVADYEFIGLVVPYKSDANIEQSLQELHGKEQGLFVLKDNTLTDGVDPIRPGDEFDLGEKTYKIEKVQVINPDGQFPILFDCVLE